MIKYLYFYLTIILLFITTGCTDVKKSLGIQKDVPNEFMIRKVEPIERPPNYDLLPPESGERNKIKQSKNDTKAIIENSLKKNIQVDEDQAQKIKKTNVENEILNQIKK